MSDAALPPAGWYKDPEPSAPSGQRRWWDGTRWSEHVQEAAPAPVQPVTVPAPTQPAPTFQPFPATTTVASPLAPAQPAFGGGGLYDPGYDRWRGKNSAATSALILGLLAVVTILLSGFGILRGVPILTAACAVIWGIIGIRRSGSLGAGKARSVWGLVLGCVSLVITVGVLIPGLMSTVAQAPTYDKTAVEKAIVDGIQKQQHQTITASCPTNPPFTVGSTFQCVATDANNQNYFVNVKVQDPAGDVTWELKPNS